MKTLIVVPVYNEEHRIAGVLDGLEAYQRQTGVGVIVVDDGSTDGTAAVCRRYPFVYHRHERNQGIGASIRDGIKYGRANGFDVVSIVSGNGKTRVEDVETFLRPIREEGYDFTKASRYLPGGGHVNLPLFRLVTTKLVSLAISVLVWRRLTDVTALVGAYKLSIFDDPRIDLDQPWLDTYELEYYILFKVIKNGYRWKEVPFTVMYPATKKNYSKIRPFTGWWKMLRPWVFLSVGLKR
jgi:dolichol-phosphate mannosyltransferase